MSFCPTESALNALNVLVKKLSGWKGCAVKKANIGAICN